MSIITHIYQPLEQFEITVFNVWDFNGYTFFFDSTLLYLLVVLFTLYFFFSISLKNIHFIPNNSWEYFSEALYQFLFDLLFQQVGEKGIKFFPLIFSLFLFVLFCNFIGMVPYGFTLTAFLVQTFTLSFSLVIGLNILGFQNQGLHFLSLFVPKGISGFLLVFVVMIEVLSHLIKPLSLGVRLFANLMSGHSLLNILSSFSLKLTKFHLLFGLVPFFVVFLVSFLEIGIAFLQAYVFVVLLCIYMNESFHVDH